MPIRTTLVLSVVLLSACAEVLAPKTVLSGKDSITIHTYYTRTGSEGEVRAIQIASAHCQKQGFAQAERTQREPYGPGTIAHAFACS